MLRQLIRKPLCSGLFLAFGFLAAAPAAVADEQFPVLKVGSEVYSNVVVTSVTATDIYFSHAEGLGNAKLKNLDPGMQRHFNFDAKQAVETERKQRESNWQYRVGIYARAAEVSAAPKLDEDGNIIPPKLYARSVLGQRPPQIVVDQWLTPPPDVKGKFVLVEFWSTTGEPSRQVIPYLNELNAKFKDRLVIVGLGFETPEAMRKMTSPHIDYSVGTDPQARTLKTIGVEGVPHAFLIDPKGIVRFEGKPNYLTEKGLKNLIARYSD
jgi:cytochrome c biogenesis protein CcmG/thiol:disulfide interchange protein DsbE